MLQATDTQPTRDNGQSTPPKEQDTVLQLWLKSIGHLPNPQTQTEEDSEGWDGGV